MTFIKGGLLGGGFFFALRQGLGYLKEDTLSSQRQWLNADFDTSLLKTSVGEEAYCLHVGMLSREGRHGNVCVQVKISLRWRGGEIK